MSGTILLVAGLVSLPLLCGYVCHSLYLEVEMGSLTYLGSYVQSISKPLQGMIKEPDPRIGPLTLLAFSSVALFASISMPILASTGACFSLRRLWTVTLTLFGISMLATLVVTSTAGTVLLFGLIGCSWASTVWIPFALLGAETSKHSPPTQQVTRFSSSRDLLDPEPVQHLRNIKEDGDHLLSHPGLIYGLHNVSICLPQMLVSLGMGLYSFLCGLEVGAHGEQILDIAWNLRLGGVFALVAAYFTTRLKDT